MFGRGLSQGLALGALVILACLGPGCETTQPTEVSTRNAVLEMHATGTVTIYDIWDFYVDSLRCSVSDAACTNDSECPFPETCTTPRDGVPDDVDFDGIPDTFLVCEATGLVEDALGPWPYTADINLILAGTANSVSLLPGGQSTLITGPLSTFVQTGVSPARPSFAQADPNFVFTNPRRVDATNELVLEAPVHPGGGPFFVPDHNYCPFGFTDLLIPTFEFQMNKGDTLEVKARKVITSTTAFNNEPILSGVLFLDGVPVVPTSGNAVSTVAPGDAIEFTFTSH